MRISHRHSFVFISKPRCASTTMRRLLDPYSDIAGGLEPPFHFHATALELKQHFDKTGWPWKDYFTFTTVRNPWDMMVSYFFYFRPDINGIYNFETERDGVAYQPGKPAMFGDWIRTGKTYHRLAFREGQWIRNSWVCGFSKLTLENTVCDADGKRLVDAIFKVEELHDQLPGLFTRLRIDPVPELVSLNRTEHGAYRQYYTDETTEMVAREFASDIDFGHYRF